MQAPYSRSAGGRWRSTASSSSGSRVTRCMGSSRNECSDSAWHAACDSSLGGGGGRLFKYATCASLRGRALWSEASCCTTSSKRARCHEEVELRYCSAYHDGTLFSLSLQVSVRQFYAIPYGIIKCRLLKLVPALALRIYISMYFINIWNLYDQLPFSYYRDYE